MNAIKTSALFKNGCGTAHFDLNSLARDIVKFKNHLDSSATSLRALAESDLCPPREKQKILDIVNSIASYSEVFTTDTLTDASAYMLSLARPAPTGFVQNLVANS